MLKSIPNFSGVLSVAVSSGAVIFSIDQLTADLLRKALGVGDWTYATVYKNAQTEIVRITGVAGGNINVVRGIDGTTAFAHGIGAVLAYVVPVAAIVDVVVQEQLNGITLTGTGGAVVTETTPKNFNVHVEPITIISANKGIDVISLPPNYIIMLK